MADRGSNKILSVALEESVYLLHAVKGDIEQLCDSDDDNGIKCLTSVSFIQDIFRLEVTAKTYISMTFHACAVYDRCTRTHRMLAPWHGIITLRRKVRVTNLFITTCAGRYNISFFLCLIVMIVLTMNLIIMALK